MTPFRCHGAIVCASAALTCALSPAASLAASLEDFAGVWQVVPRGPPGEPPGGAPGGRGGRAGPDRDRLPPPPGGRGGRGGQAQAQPGELEGLDNGDRMVRQQMTAAGQAAFDAIDPADHPANNCLSPGLPSIAMTPNLQVWSLEGGDLAIHHEYFDTFRTVHLNGAAPTPGHSAQGYAAGSFDGSVLTIETTGLTETIGGLARNAPGSDARSVTERYWRTDEDSLVGQITLRDPKYLRGELVLSVELRRAPPGSEIVSFPCDVEASRRHLDGP